MVYKLKTEKQLNSINYKRLQEKNWKNIQNNLNRLYESMFKFQVDYETYTSTTTHEKKKGWKLPYEYLQKRIPVHNERFNEIKNVLSEETFERFRDELFYMSVYSHPCIPSKVEFYNGYVSNGMINENRENYFNNLGYPKVKESFKENTKHYFYSYVQRPLSRCWDILFPSKHIIEFNLQGLNKLGVQ